YFHQMISEIRDYVREDQLIISIAAGRTLDYIQSEFGGKKVKVVRLMPNTPAMVGEGMTAACANGAVSKEELDYAVRICSGFGKAEIVPESLFDVVTAVSGSSPAYVFMFIEAMADAAVQGGMPRAQAYIFAAQAVLGSAKMVLDTGKHPGELKDMVTSPAGTTIEAVRVLEEKGFRSAVFECVKACTEKSAEMRKSK
ncbi:MAG: pyrroline-5-carboxylate reductase, partial [bacterium]